MSEYAHVAGQLDQPAGARPRPARAAAGGWAELVASLSLFPKAFSNLVSKANL